MKKTTLILATLLIAIFISSCDKDPVIPKYKKTETLKDSLGDIPTFSSQEAFSDSIEALEDDSSSSISKNSRAGSTNKYTSDADNNNEEKDSLVNALINKREVKETSK